MFGTLNRHARNHSYYIIGCAQIFECMYRAWVRKPTLECHYSFLVIKIWLGTQVVGQPKSYRVGGKCIEPFLIGTLQKLVEGRVWWRARPHRKGIDSYAYTCHVQNCKICKAHTSSDLQNPSHIVPHAHNRLYVGARDLKLAHKPQICLDKKNNRAYVLDIMPMRNKGIRICMRIKKSYIYIFISRYR